MEPEDITLEDLLAVAGIEVETKPRAPSREEVVQFLGEEYHPASLARFFRLFTEAAEASFAAQGAKHPDYVNALETELRRIGEPFDRDGSPPAEEEPE